MCADFADTLSRLERQVPELLHEKLAGHWQDWNAACGDRCDPGVDLESLGRIWACSEFVASSCCRRPEQWFELLDQGLLDRVLTFRDYQSELKSLLSTTPAANDTALMQQLRRFRQKHMLRIAWRDLADLAPTGETLANLTDLAEACVDETLEFLYQDMCGQLGTPMDEQDRAQRMIVLGMGKLGGHELNFSSDIDLIFAFPEEGETRNGRRSLANSQFFTRLGQRLIRVLDDVTADGFVFRVDMRLRPYGDSGPLVMSFDGMEHYYQTQGREWERYAMIKARVIGGDREAGRELMDMLRPFVYRRYLDFGAFESIREMKAMIEKEVRRKGNRDNIKLGRGGIREIEFIGQTYQLIRGGGEPDLQVRSILAVLELLGRKGYLSEQEVEKLQAGYDFLRRLENRLQMYADAQTHSLPEDPMVRASMTLAMGYDDWDRLYEDAQVQLGAMHDCFKAVFALDAEGTESNGDNPLVRIWQDELDDEEACELLHREGIVECDEVVHQLTAFRDSGLIRSLVGSSRQRLDKLMPLLLQSLPGMEAPGEVMKRLLNLLQAIVRRSVYLSLLIEYPVALEQLIKLCAASPWIAHLLARYPILLDELLDPRSLYHIPDRDQLGDELETMLSQVAGDEEQELDVLRKFKQAHVLGVAAMDVMGNLRVFDVSEHLTLISEVLLEKVYRLAWRHMVERHGKPRCRIDGQDYEPGMAIVAYGKMGGEELGYGSDLDLVFLHDSRGDAQMTDGRRSLDNNTFFARLAQRMVHLLSAQTSTGRLYEVDTRLRPDGAAGMLVSSMEAFEQYQREKAWTWEHQALIRARIVLGGAHLAGEFDRIRRSVLTQPRDVEALRSDVVEMRRKMRKSLGSKKPGQFHLKHDEGGLVDIEFLVQFNVLAHAEQHPELVRFTAIRLFLRALEEYQCLKPTQVTVLLEAYELYRARGHQRALQEQSSTLDDTEFVEQRDHVTRVWNKVMGD